MVTKLAKTIVCVIQFVACLSKKKKHIKQQRLLTEGQLFNHIDLREVFTRQSSLNWTEIFYGGLNFYLI